MAYFVTLKHGEVNRHEGMVDALLDFVECSDNPPGHGAEMWWENPELDATLAERARVEACYDVYGPETHDAHVQVYGACAWCRSTLVLG